MGAGREAVTEVLPVGVPGAVAMQTAVRQALDPKRIFNPGKG
jgi:FAD/FMN-containing dehydrogenase